MLSYMLFNPSFKNFMFEPVLSYSTNLVRAFTNCSVSHVYKETNRCTYSLTKIGAMQNTCYLFLYDPPLVVETMLVFNKIERFSNKMVVSS